MYEKDSPTSHQISARCKPYEEPVKLFEDNVLYLEWWADLGDRRCVGVDTLVFQDGQITVHTIKYDFKELGNEPR